MSRVQIRALACDFDQLQPDAFCSEEFTSMKGHDDWLAVRFQARRDGWTRRQVSNPRQVGGPFIDLCPEHSR